MNDALVKELMDEFADSTGLTGKVAPRRYLWTDAFAVRNFLDLFRQTAEIRFLDLAEELVDQVHHVLGCHRADDARRGWISGLSKEEGELHPTAGGLRIGKQLSERPVDEPMDSRLEWDRDGQYFHYLTRWMHALDRMGQETGEARYYSWAIELAIATVGKFIHTDERTGRKWIAWKMSVDLTRPLVDSMGQHDAVDGLINCLILRSTNASDESISEQLAAAITDLDELCKNPHWVTDDPLGIGGLLEDARLLAQIAFEHNVRREDLLFDVLVAALASLRYLQPSTFLNQAADRRLAFRELGLAIGLKGMDDTKSLCVGRPQFQHLCDEISTYQPLGQRIQEYWTSGVHRQNATWLDHQDINDVMLATSIV